MTYATLKSEFGRRPVWIVEVDLDYCAETYGAAPCTAAVGVTGPAKCYNTRKTCQDPANYNRGTKTYRLSNLILPPSSDLEFQAIPCVEDVTLLPTRIEPGKGIGKRAVLTVTLKDQAHADTGIDKYLSGRGYDSSTRGTFFTKLLARNPYYQGRALRVRTGYLVDGQSPDSVNFETRLYHIERIEGPDKDGRVRIIAKDPLKALDDKRSQAPRPSSGTLSMAIDDTVGTLTLAPAGVGDEEYPAAGKVRVDDEVMSFTRAADVLTLTRGTNFTTAVAHDASAPVQLCLSYSGTALVDILYELITDYAGIDSSLIDLAAWNAEADVWLTDYDLTAVVTSPMGVATLVTELCEQCQFFIWWDERVQKIGLKAVRPWAFDQVAELNDTDHIIANSQSVRDRPDDRLSKVLVYYGQKNPTEDLAKPWNFQRLKATIDEDAESADEFGDARIRTIYSRWLSAAQQAQAIKLSSRLLSRYRNNPRTITFRLDAKDSDAWTGDTVLATMRTIVDYSGAKLPSYLQVIEVKEMKVGTEYDYILEDTGFSGRYALWGPDTLPAFPDADDPTRARYGFWADAGGLMSDGSEGYKYA